MARFFALIFLVLACVRPAAADAVFAENGVAVRGTDVVAYFTVGDVVPGKPEFRHDWNGAAWHFASAQNRDAFAADPQRYAPQYGGFCAWAVANNYTAPIDPEAWRIVDGKLYLNYSRFVQLRWDMSRAANISKADANWPALSRR
ncbi:MAG: YHS domain protein [Tagaea sp. CACIAM 22H2]|nr:YHS domain protein [Tagaea sp. CACIAM 22H2]